MRRGSFPKIGLALGSGGAKGLTHIGVIKILEEHNIPIDFIAGASIGAVIAAYYAATPDRRKLQELAHTFSQRKGFSLFDPTLRGGLIKGAKIETVIHELLDGASFDTLKIPCAIVATDFNTAEDVVITHGDIVKAVRASISVPGFFQPIQFDNRLLADGGLSEPVPVEVVRKMGADIVIAVNLDNATLDSNSVNIPTLSSVPMRSINILRHHLALESTKTADVVIVPSVYQVGLIGWNYFFDDTKIQALINEGEKAALHALPKLQLHIKEKQKRGWRKFLPFIKELMF